jgi:WD40 repeat protein
MSSLLDEHEVFVYPPPDELKCPVCFDLFKEPIITKDCSHSFCKICFEKSLVTKASCPTCRAPAFLESVHPNRIVSGIIEQLHVHCKYGLKHNSSGDWVVATGPSACPAVVKRNMRKEHEKNCAFAVSSCPHFSRGCPVSGIAAEIEAHLKVCPYEALKPYILRQEEHLTETKRTTKVQATEIVQLKKKIELLSLAVAQVQEALVKAGGMELLGKLESDVMYDIDSFDNNEKAMQKAVQKGLKCLYTLASHEDTVESLVMDDTRLYSASWDHTIKVWNADTWECTHTLKSTSDVRELLTYHECLYTGCGNGTIQVWSLDTLRPINTARKHSDDILALRMYNDRLFSGSSDTTIKVWHPATLECLDTMKGHNNWVFALVGGHNKVFSGSSDQSIKVWDVGETMAHVHTIVGHTDQIRALALSGNNLFSGSYDCSIKIWDCNSYQCINTLEASNEIFGLQSMDSYLFSGDEHGNVKIWDLRTMQCVQTLMDHTGSVYAFAVHGTSLLSASSDTTIKVWG